MWSLTFQTSGGQIWGLYSNKGSRKKAKRRDVFRQVPEEPFVVPLGTVQLVRSGSDLTILANMLMVHKALNAAEQLTVTGGWGAEVTARLVETAFYHLDAPIARLAAPDTPAPCSHSLERIYVPQRENIVERARNLVRK